MKGRLFLDIVVRESATIFELLTSEDQTLLVWWDSFLILKKYLSLNKIMKAESKSYLFRILVPKVVDLFIVDVNFLLSC